MRKRPRDLNQWAKYMVDLATGNAQEPPPSPSNKNSAAASTKRSRWAPNGGRRQQAPLGNCDIVEVLEAWEAVN